VHGDTTTSYATALASFYQAVPVGHVEAGLRTENILAPWPEEFNRRSVDMIADMLWAPTETAGLALRNEGACPENVHVTGNTVVDAINLIKSKIENDASLRAALWTRLPRLEANKKLILVTGHRRESFGSGLAEVCQALNCLAGRKDVEIVWPVHPNPEVIRTVRSALQSRPNVHLIAPLEYVAFTALMMRAYIIVTDSGGIQEEAPSLSKPVLVTRNETERPEAIAAGTAKLVGTNAQVIVDTASLLLNDSAAYFTMAGRSNPFGDGTAAKRIVDSRHAEAMTHSATICSDGSLQ
jgi:UDP-N-acetylglucosamine 2-epimerase (hydrolysing)